MTTGGWVEGRVVRWQHWDEGLATLQLDAEVQPFEAGQFFQLGLDLGGERVRRSYSASSAPGEPLEFYLTNVPSGVLTPSLFGLRPGDRLWVESTPRGFFTLRYVPPVRCLWLVATGTGLGPFVSMLRAAGTWQHAERFVLVHGVRTAAQLAYRAELEQLSGHRPFHYIPVVSRPGPPGDGPPGDGPTGDGGGAPAELSGRVTTLLSEGALEGAAGMELRPEDQHVLLCGNPQMITDMMTLLEGRGLRRHRVRQPGHVTFEKYW